MDISLARLRCLACRVASPPLLLSLSTILVGNPWSTPNKLMRHERARLPNSKMSTQNHIVRHYVAAEGKEEKGREGEGEEEGDRATEAEAGSLMQCSVVVSHKP